MMTEDKPITEPKDSMQAVIDLYKQDVDRSLIRANLKLTVEQRLLNLMNFVKFANELREAGKKLREKK